MDLGEIVKNIAPYAVSIIGSFWAYMQAKKKMSQELEIVKSEQ